MSQSPYRAVSTRSTPQKQAIPGEAQIRNSEDAFVYEVDDWTRLNRFLILGSELGTYYTQVAPLTLDNAEATLRCIHADGERAVREIVSVSQGGRAHKNDPAIFALAMAAKLGDENTRRAAHAALAMVCRTGTHLFQFADFVESFGGWGRGTRNAVGRWYLGREVGEATYQAVKYRQREGWEHRDLLRLAHPKPDSPERDLLFKWITADSGDETLKERFKALYHDGGHDLFLPEDHALRMIEGFERAQRAQTPEQTVEIVREYALPREALRTEHVNTPEVQSALLETGMPMTALIRNLGNLTRSGVLAPGSDATRLVIEQLGDEERLRKARVHPMSVLLAMKTYAAGRGFRSRGEGWTPVVEIVDALDETFYAAFGNVTPTGKRVLLAIDVSGSMSHPCLGSEQVTCREAAGAMALITNAVEDRVETVAFASRPGTAAQGRYGAYGAGDASGADYASAQPNDRWGMRLGLSAVPMSRRQRLDDALKTFDAYPMLGTDCSLPMLYAQERSREIDAFIIYTDSETWAGDIHPSQALREYRRQSGIQDAALVVVGMASNRFSIADPNDARMMDVAGFDTAAPEAMSAFVRGEI